MFKRNGKIVLHVSVITAILVTSKRCTFIRTKTQSTPHLNPLSKNAPIWATAVRTEGWANNLICLHYEQLSAWTGHVAHIRSRWPAMTSHFSVRNRCFLTWRHWPLTSFEIITYKIPPVFLLITNDNVTSFNTIPRDQMVLLLRFHHAEAAFQGLNISLRYW